MSVAGPEESADTADNVLVSLCSAGELAAIWIDIVLLVSVFTYVLMAVGCVGCVVSCAVVAVVCSAWMLDLGSEFAD